MLNNWLRSIMKINKISQTTRAMTLVCLLFSCVDSNEHLGRIFLRQFTSLETSGKPE